MISKALSDKSEKLEFLVRENESIKARLESLSHTVASLGAMTSQLSEKHLDNVVYPVLMKVSEQEFASSEERVIVAAMKNIPECSDKDKSAISESFPDSSLGRGVSMKVMKIIDQKLDETFGDRMKRLTVAKGTLLKKPESPKGDDSDLSRKWMVRSQMP